MARDDEHVELEGHVVHRTDKAVLFFITKLDDEPTWFPLSQCDGGTSIRRTWHADYDYFHVRPLNRSSLKQRGNLRAYITRLRRSCSRSSS